MSKIQNLSEPWAGHTFAEVQNFIKENFKYSPACPQPEAVDLGLSSGTKWADRNVGASAPEDFGLYFSWGNVDGHKAVQDGNDWVTEDGYIFDGVWDDDKSAWMGGNYGKTQGAALSADIVAGAKAYDAAAANLGSPWKMPTNAQIEELIAGTTQSVTTRNGVSGMLFTSKTNSNSVFFPFSGYVGDGSDVFNVGDDGYFYSVGCDGNSAGCLSVDSDGGVNLDDIVRFFGYPVRAVQ